MDKRPQSAALLACATVMFCLTATTVPLIGVARDMNDFWDGFILGSPVFASVGSLIAGLLLYRQAHQDQQ